MQSAELFDVVSVNIKTGTIEWLVADKDDDNAEAVIKMAVMRRGVESSFYGKARAGKYHVGDKWEGGQ